MSGPFVYLWEFEVPPETKADFLQHYGPDGEWARLFRRAPAYLGTWLLKDQANPERYLTVDRWRSQEAYAAFLERFRADYQALDQRCEGFTRREASLGSFWQVGGGERS
ncbi:MAG TPA: antibiotic biosynthesis monooxygenase [Thermoanaerobaculia bacterium]|nr:antibiotic biosynthesis monooxygenase [Thermoanaerobaculia bacterium]